MTGDFQLYNCLPSGTSTEQPKGLRCHSHWPEDPGVCQATQVQEGLGDTGHAWFMLLVMEGEDRIRPGLLRGSKSLG